MKINYNSGLTKGLSPFSFPCLWNLDPCHSTYRTFNSIPTIHFWTWDPFSMTIYIHIDMVLDSAKPHSASSFFQFSAIKLLNLKPLQPVLVNRLKQHPLPLEKSCPLQSNLGIEKHVTCQSLFARDSPEQAVNKKIFIR